MAARALAAMLVLPLSLLLGRRLRLHLEGEGAAGEAWGGTGEAEEQFRKFT